MHEEQTLFFLIQLASTYLKFQSSFLYENTVFAIYHPRYFLEISHCICYICQLVVYNCCKFCHTSCTIYEISNVIWKYTILTIFLINLLNKKTSEKSHQCKIQIICNNWYYAYLSTSTKSGLGGTQNLLESPWTNIIHFEISQWSLCFPVKFYSAPW